MRIFCTFQRMVSGSMAVCACVCAWMIILGLFVVEFHGIRSHVELNVRHALHLRAGGPGINGCVYMSHDLWFVIRDSSVAGG